MKGDRVRDRQYGEFFPFQINCYYSSYYIQYKIQKHFTQIMRPKSPASTSSYRPFPPGRINLTFLSPSPTKQIKLWCPQQTKKLLRNKRNNEKKKDTTYRITWKCTEDNLQKTQPTEKTFATSSIC